MGEIVDLEVTNYRSIGDEVVLRFPQGSPVVLVGENNAGKSNLIRALDLVIGETWPGSYDPEDHEYHRRDKGNVPMWIEVHVTGIEHADRDGPHVLDSFCIEIPGTDPFRMTYRGGGESKYVNKGLREQCRSIVVSADRRLSYHLGYSSKWTLLAKLMREFHSKLQEDSDRVARLDDLFRSIKTEFAGIPEFASFVDELKRGTEDLGGNLAYRLDIDFSAYDPSHYFRSLRVFPYEDGEVRTLDELGTGQEQVLALAFAQAYASAFHGAQGGLVLVIEEPEAHLHPLAQQWLSERIHSKAADGLQILVSSHSPAFVDINHLAGVARVYKVDGDTRVVQLTPEDLALSCRNHGAARATADSVIPFYAAAATQEILAGLFARRIVLVEGPTEALAIPAYLSRVGLSTTREGIAVIPVGGVGSLAKWWRFFRAFEIPVYVVFDNDSGEDADNAKRTDLLRTIGVPEARLSEILGATTWMIGKPASVFGANFEATLKSEFGEDYERLEQEAITRFALGARSAKPLLARYVAECLPYEQAHSGWIRFSDLANRIQDIAG